MRVKVPSQSVGQRLDAFLSRQLPNHSRSNIAKLCESNKVAVNRLPAKASYKLKNDDKIELDLPSIDIPAIDLPVIYEDHDCIVVDKPAGVLTHSKGALNPEGTVATFIAPKVKDLHGERAGIVHRLDRITSGVIIAAKNPASLKWLQKQFSQRKTKKTYIALISGQLNPQEAIIDMPIERNPKKPQTFRVGSNGKAAKTTYKSISNSDSTSLVELIPETGRTHQLRVHLSHLGHPIIGDTLYGGPAAKRVYLHAKSLEITLPSKQRRIFESPVPSSFREELDK